MKLISWNVNGLRAAVQKGFLDYFNQENADIFCLQETKLKLDKLILNLMDIINIGIMLKKKVTLEQLFSLKKSLYLLLMD